MNYLYSSPLEELVFHWRKNKNAVYSLPLNLRVFQWWLLSFLLKKRRCKSRSWSRKLGEGGCFLKAKPAAKKHPLRRWRKSSYLDDGHSVWTHRPPATLPCLQAVLLLTLRKHPSLRPLWHPSPLCTGLHWEGSCSVSVWKTRKQHS